jgi:hypothetical protein
VPKIFAIKNRFEIPGWSLAISALPGVLAYVLIGEGSNNVLPM